MTRYEILSVLGTVVSLVIALTALVRTRRIAERQLQLQKVAADLAATQLEIIRRDEKPRLAVRLEQRSGNWFFAVVNEGKVEVRDLYFALDGRATDNPLDTREHAEKFPIKVFRPGDKVTLLAMFDGQSSRKYGVLLTWNSAAGVSGQESFDATW